MVSGTNSVSYELKPSTDWITISPSTGTNINKIGSHRVTIDTDKLVYGINSGYITISGNATNLPRNIPVRIYKPELPVITMQPSNVITYYPSNQIIQIEAEPGKSYAPDIVNEIPQYQWYYNGKPIENETNSFCYTIGFGSYQCEIITLGGRIRSKEVVIQLPEKGSRFTVTQITATDFTVSIENVQSGKFTLQSSTDMKQWTDLKTYDVPLGASVKLKVNMNTQDAKRFYRLRE